MSINKNEKNLLYKLYGEQNPEAFVVLYDLYVKQIYRFIYFKVSKHEEAEDITSEVFLKAWHYIQEKKEIKSFSGLLYKIARNCIVDLYRSRSAKPEVALSEEIEVADGGAWFETVRTNVESQRIIEIIKKLKQEYQEVITLRYVDELETEEIAAIVGKGRIAVRVTLHRALKKLRELVENENENNC